MDKMNLKDLSLEDLEKLITEKGYPKYRAKQIFSWIYKDINHFGEMKNLPDNIIQLSDNIFRIGRARILEKQTSKDGTVKYLLGIDDDNAIECVLMKYEFGNSLCISTQVGCRMGCRFCASTIGGLVRNLTSGEMIEEIMAISRDASIRISNIVLMGIGEPFDNYIEVVKFLKTANSQYGLNIGMRHITISTSGLVPKIYNFADEKLQCNLAISLHSANNKKRSQLMPINIKYNIEELIKACDYYISKTNRRITFEYALIDKVNDDIQDAKELSLLLKNMLCHVNLIPLNHIPGRELNKSNNEKTIEFKNVLEKSGINVTIRRELGVDIDGACGQLRRKIDTN